MINKLRAALGTPCFPLGRIEIEPNSAKKLASEDIIPALSRHLLGDWGKVTQHRRNANQLAVLKEKPLHSEYFSDRGIRFQVVTNGARSLTTVKAL